MSAAELQVLIGESRAGTLTRNGRGLLSIAYDEAYAASTEATPLSVGMPLNRIEHADDAIRPWLAGLLPDDERVRARWARELHVSAASPFSLLATPIGEDVPGAVRFVRPERLDEVLADRTSETDVRWLDDAELADLLRGLLRDRTAWLGPGFTGRFSLAGAQAKTALLRHEGRWGVPAGRLATTHILKPAVEGLDEHDLNEHLCLTAMRLSGLPVALTTIVTAEDVTAVAVRRYDRTGNGLRRGRVHQEDICQALGLSPESKYQAEGGPGPRDIAQLIRRTHGSEAAAEAAVRTLLDSLLWNWIVASTDGHAKNYSLLLAGSQVRLAPLYDVASALPYDVPEQKLRLAMKLGSSYLLNPGGNPWRHLAAALSIDEDGVRATAARWVDEVPDAFARTAQLPDVVALGSTLPQRLSDLVEQRAGRCHVALRR